MANKVKDKLLSAVHFSLFRYYSYFSLREDIQHTAIGVVVLKLF